MNVLLTSSRKWLTPFESRLKLLPFSLKEKFSLKLSLNTILRKLSIKYTKKRKNNSNKTKKLKNREIKAQNFT